tara:strand:- start:65 stop:334 length:270 start_codon:yes stop_codon:yes gene_type:complete
MKYAVIMILLLLPGCAAIGAAEIFTTLGGWAADGIVQAQTGKSIPDKIVSDITGKDCNLKQLFNSKNPICVKSKEKDHGKEEIKDEPNK